MILLSQRLQQEADNQSRRLAQTAMVETDDEDQPVKKPSNQEQSGHEAHSPEPKVGFSKSKYTLFTKTQTSVPHFVSNILSTTVLIFLCTNIYTLLVLMFGKKG